MSDQPQREALLKRKFGMSEEGVAKLRKFNDMQSDWYATCQKCGEKLEGTLKQIKEHVCGV